MGPIHPLRMVLPALLACLLLTACDSIVADTEALLRPPTLNSKQAEVYAALESTVNIADIVYKYPQTGEFRSPFVFYDMDGDGREEAIIFYSYQTDQANTRTKILRQADGGGWAPLHDFSTTCEQVDFVQFSRLLSDSAACMIVGWQGGGQAGRHTDNFLGVYSFIDGVFSTEITKQRYIDYTIHDFDGDNRDEVVIIERAENQTLRVSLLRPVGRHIDVTASLPLCPEADILLQITPARLWNGSGAVYIDEVRTDAFTATEIVQVTARGLNILCGGPEPAPDEDLTPAWDKYTYTIRDHPVLSRDYSGGREVEVPNLLSLPGNLYEGEEDPLLLTQLMRLTADGFTVSDRGVINDEEGYILLYPDSWMDPGSELRDALVSVIREFADAEWRFYLIDPLTGEATTELLRIQAIDGGGAEAGGAGNIIDLGSRGTRRFTGYIPLTGGDAPAITETQLKEMFRILS